MSDGRILVIDDDPLILKLLQTTIERSGFEVLTASDGEQGLEVIRGEHPDMVISDIMMPRVDGFELIRRLRGDRLVGATPLMMLSAKGEEEDKVKGLEMGADDYLTKPFSPRELVARVRALIRRKAAVRERVPTTSQAPFTVEGLTHLAEYRFDNYVVGAGNRSAVEAAKAAAESPGNRFNPLFLFGGSGLGKTHLMCALANETYSRHPESRIRYVSSEVFSQQVLDAHERREVEDLKLHYTSLELLMVDDIQFLAISPSLQMVAAEILYDMYEHGKQIVITSDRKPEELEALSAEMTSGFAFGLVVEIDRPDATLRSRILRFKARQRGWDISEEVLDYLATRLDTDVRSIEGAARKLVAMKAFGGATVDRSTVDDLVKTNAHVDEPPEGKAGNSAREGAVPVTSRVGEPPAESDTLVQEFSREIPVVRIVGYPEEVAHSMPEQAAPVVVLGPSAALVMDTVEALVGKREHAPRIPEGDRWAYLVHVEGKARWVIVGSVSWTPGDDLSKAAEASYPPTYLVVLDSMSPKITEARKLVATLPQGRAAAVVVMVSVGEDGLQAAKETLSRSLRRLFRVPEDIPLLVSGGVGTAESRKWLRLARG
ncbi:MAG: DnaA/Hda family protein [Candidatus Eisenbacteria bacterium]|nr:DnaA/Hda family protein [Candidatus Eisenbacteria bacterium]